MAGKGPDDLPTYRKGISIAMETIVFIVLAVLVLTVLLFFFTSQAGPAQQRFKWEAQRNDFCQQYVSADPTCQDPLKITDAADRTRILNGIGEACSSLKIPGCSATANAQCIKNCCLYCSGSQP